MNDLLVVLFTLVFASGVTLVSIGTLFSIATTAGLNEKLGLVSIFIPPVALVYCILNRDKAAYPLKLLGSGLILLAAVFIVVRVMIK